MLVTLKKNEMNEKLVGNCERIIRIIRILNFRQYC